MTAMVAGISKAAVEREAAMMEASSNFIWARKLRALRAALDKAEAERDGLVPFCTPSSAAQPDAAAIREAALREAAAAAWAVEGGDRWTRSAAQDAILALLDKPKGD